MKKIYLSAPILLLALLVGGCSTPLAPPPPQITPTPLPIIVAEPAPEPTDLAPISGSIQSAETDIPLPDETQSLDFKPSGEVAVESISIRSLNRSPVKILVSVSGTILKDCLEIDDWKQTVRENTIFLVPQLARLEDDQCPGGPVSFDDTVDLKLQDYSVSELISKDYTLDVNGFFMNLGFVVSGSLLQEQVSGCPVRSVGELLYFNEGAGFCLLFPDTFTIQEEDEPGVVSFYGPALDDDELDPLQAKLFVRFQERIGGRDLEQITREKLAEYESEDRDPAISPSVLDGEQAVMIERAGEMTGSLEILAPYNGVVFAISLLPHEGFPDATGDVELAWDLALDSFTFLRPPAGQDEEQVMTLNEFEHMLKEAVISQDFDRLQELMDDSFGIAFWLSEGYEVTAEEAVEQLQLSYWQSDGSITFEDDLPDLSPFLGADRDALSIWNPEVNPVSSLFSTGWGSDGKSEAILIVSQSPEGVFAWDGIILANGEMGGFTGPAAGGG